MFTELYLNIFNIIDVAGNKEINLDEFLDGIQIFNLDFTEEEYKRIFYYMLHKDPKEEAEMFSSDEVPQIN